VYSAGNTVSPSFPTVHPFQGTLSGGQDATITKLAPDGSTRLYATYFGGTGDDWVNAIDVDETGQIYIAGVTQSGDLPTKNAIQPSYAGGSHDCWVAKLKADGSGLIYSTYWGGTGEELCFVSAGRHGDAYVTGDTYSADFPVVKALQPALKGLSEGIVVKLDANGSVVYSTYLGGSGDDGTGTVNIGPNDVAYIGGNTNSDDFPVYRAVQSHLGGSPAHNPDAIAVKLSPNGELLFSTYLGGSYYDVGGAVVPDAAGNMYVSGTTWSDDFPVRHAFQPAFGGGADAFVAKIADPWCPTDVTSRVDVLKFPPKQFIFGFLRFQLVAIHNKTSSSIGGPLALVLSDLQQAAFIGSSWKTQCFSPEGDPFTLVSAGFDGLLRPNESRLTTLWFLNTNPDQLAYVPHVLSGIPVQ
jgi:hypothetical protein